MVGILNLQSVIKVFKDIGLPIVRTKNKAPIVNAWQKLAINHNEWGGNLQTATEAGFVITADIVVIDVDPRNFNEGVNSLQELSKAINFDLEANAKFSTKTASDGLHLYYKKKSGIKFPNECDKFKGVEFKQIGQHVVLPWSVLPEIDKKGNNRNGKVYYNILHNEIENLVEIPQTFYDVIGIRATNKAINIGSGFKNHTTDILRLRQLLEKTPPANEGSSGDKATYNVCCLGKDYGLSPDVFFELLCEWNEKCSPPWQLDDLRVKMLNAYSYSHNQAGSHSVEEMFGKIEQSFLSTEDANKQEEALINWKDELQVNKNGGYKTTLKNSVLFIKHDEHLRGKIAFNEFSGDKVWTEPTYWHNTKMDSFLPNGRLWTEIDAIKTRYILNNYNFDVGTNLIYEAVTELSTSNHYHPVKEWFEKNSNWDKVERIDTFFTKYCGADDNVYSKEVARKMFCAIVARVFNPGCKFDYLPIFVGKQGIGKSTLLKILSIHPSWFCDNIGDITNAKEVIPQTRGKLIVEWQELALFSKIDINHSKSFLSTSVDRVREAYHREAKDYPRQFIVIATTNQDKFLLDETGNRRMLPIELKSIDTTAVAEILTQLYAEAVKMYREGEKLYITNKDALEIAEQIQSDRFRNDEIEETITDWLDNMPEEIKHICTKEKLQVNDVIIYALKESPTKARGLANRVSNILRRLGYQRQSYRMDGNVKQGFVKKVL